MKRRKEKAVCEQIGSGAVGVVKRALFLVNKQAVTRNINDDPA